MLRFGAPLGFLASKQKSCANHSYCGAGEEILSGQSNSARCYGGRSRLYRTAREAVERSMQYSYVGRKQRKRDFRTLWILRINAGARLSGLSYSRFMHGLKQAGIELNRKVLADLAVYHKDDFAKIVDLAKAALN